MTGAVHPLLAAGDVVQAWLWELPEIAGDRLRSDGYSPHQRFRLNTDDHLEPMR
ncbi:hypothetical protein HH308_09645 [Gordonia sp. TBRC 11910]|uniref:Uncharacterized protein n=1 Tax=Gordonia asplenii TaxID=2725283 RepID=A0A848KR78_9ACTN|nr:hypothetical protein [Gordonia asplenii]NMO01474.1 hypothetical protein [Gordonia asplenii]